ncbi:hypothetical protein EI94DRAFT_1820520 [Lactarius quietus]|nr:hypothetical protein EI94DRAFT_1820520 [Lactarius quietus]
MEHLSPTSHRLLDARPRLKDIAQGQAPATSDDKPSAALARGGRLNEHPLKHASTEPTEVQKKEPSMLLRVPGILAGCGFSDDSLVAVLDYTVTRTISREVLVQVPIPVLEYLKDQPEVGHRTSHAHADQTKLGCEKALTRHFEESSRPLGLACPGRRRKHFHLLYTLATQFGAQLVERS